MSGSQKYGFSSNTLIWHRRQLKRFCFASVHKLQIIWLLHNDFNSTRYYHLMRRQPFEPHVPAVRTRSKSKLSPARISNNISQAKIKSHFRTPPVHKCSTLFLNCWGISSWISQVKIFWRHLRITELQQRIRDDSYNPMGDQHNHVLVQD